MTPFASTALAKRTYREVKLLKQLRHENVCVLYDLRQRLRLVVKLTIASSFAYPISSYLR